MQYLCRTDNLLTHRPYKGILLLSLTDDLVAHPSDIVMLLVTWLIKSSVWHGNKYTYFITVKSHEDNHASVHRHSMNFPNELAHPYNGHFLLTRVHAWVVTGWPHNDYINYSPGSTKGMNEDTSNARRLHLNQYLSHKHHLSFTPTCVFVCVCVSFKWYFGC